MRFGRVIPFWRKNRIDKKSIYVTYDIDQTGGGQEPILYQVTQELPIRGAVISWETGEFKMMDVTDVYGVKIRYRSAEDGVVKEKIVETSRYAQSIQVFVGQLPVEYQEGLQRSA